MRSPTRITSSGGADLEARWDEPAAAIAAAVVFCHPHPQHGGTMRAPLMHKVTKALLAAGLSVLRFNFRGVGASTGEWSGGPGEIEDVGAAMAAARGRFGSDVALAGWSFGAAAALRWQAAASASGPYVGIAPPLVGDLAPALPAPAELNAGRRLLVLGDRDQFVTPAALGAYAESIGAVLEVLAGSDHFFYLKEQQVGDLMAGFLTEE
jgi:alpha/beta superfamily hydrolase